MAKKKAARKSVTAQRTKGPRGARARGVPHVQGRRAAKQTHGAIPGGPGSGPDFTPAMPNPEPPARQLEERGVVTRAPGQPPASERARMRNAMLEALYTMPDEAFGWFVAWSAGVQGSMFPEGLGGFPEPAQQAILALRTAAKRYIEATS